MIETTTAQALRDAEIAQDNLNAYDYRNHRRLGWSFETDQSVGNGRRPLADAADLTAADAYAAFVDEQDATAADAYAAHVASIVRAAYAARTPVGETERSAYYDVTRYAFDVPSLALDANAVRSILAARDGQSMASYGSFGGYSTVGRVTQETPVRFVVESVYHIGD